MSLMDKKEEEGPLHHALHDFSPQGYVDVKDREFRIFLRVLDVIKPL